MGAASCFDNTTESKIDTAFATLIQFDVRGLIIAADQFLDSRRERIVILAARYSVPVI
jgi:hypothetical protein